MHLLSAHESTNTHGPHNPCATGARPQNLPSVLGGFCPMSQEAALRSPVSESAQCLRRRPLGDGPWGPDLGSAPRRMRSNQGPRSLRLTRESLGTRWLRVAAPSGRGAGTPRAGRGQHMGGEGQDGLWTVAAGTPSEHRSPAPARVRPWPWTRQQDSVRGLGKQFQSSTLCSQARPPGLRRLPGPDLC